MRDKPVDQAQLVAAAAPSPVIKPLGGNDSADMLVRNPAPNASPVVNAPGAGYRRYEIAS